MWEGRESQSRRNWICSQNEKKHKQERTRGSGELPQTGVTPSGPTQNAEISEVTLLGAFAPYTKQREQTWRDKSISSGQFCWCDQQCSGNVPRVLGRVGENPWTYMLGVSRRWSRRGSKHYRLLRTGACDFIHRIPTLRLSSLYPLYRFGNRGTKRLREKVGYTFLSPTFKGEESHPSPLMLDLDMWFAPQCEWKNSVPS